MAGTGLESEGLGREDAASEGDTVDAECSIPVQVRGQPRRSSGALVC